MKEKKCAKCGIPFTCCNPEGGCWCDGLRVDRENLAYLKEHFSDCLCLTCLQSFAVKESKQEKPGKSDEG